MKRYKITTTTETENLDTNIVETTEKTIFRTIKTWGELTKEEKEAEIEKNGELIYADYQDYLYEVYKDNLSSIKEQYKNIDFEDVYLDSNSHGGWIDKVKDFRVYYSIDIFGETIEVDDIDLHIGKYINAINENDINIRDYYIDTDTMNRITNTKKYKDFIQKIIEEVNNWIDDINNAARDILKNEYCYPYNLDDTKDADYLAGYFCNAEFVFESNEV